MWLCVPPCPQIVQLIMQVLLATHFVGCFFFWASSMDDGPDTGHWYTEPGMPATMIDRYVAAVYWSLTTVRHCDHCWPGYSVHP